MLLWYSMCACDGRFSHECEHGTVILCYQTVFKFRLTAGKLVAINLKSEVWSNKLKAHASIVYMCFGTPNIFIIMLIFGEVWQIFMMMNIHDDMHN